jgi:hypothetical protein
MNGRPDAVAGVTGEPDPVAEVTDVFEFAVCAVVEDGNGCSVYLTRLRGKAAGELMVGTDISKR